jgi:hypothetical protein
MKKLTLSFFIVILLCTSIHAQSPAKTIFVELAGPGLASLNYDMRFTKSEKGIGGRIGIGGFTIGPSGDRVSILTIPIGINYLLGKDEKNYFELGAGFTPIFLKETFSSSSDKFQSSFGHLNFGYRLQPKNGGFLFRASINPIFSSEGFYPLFGGISFGYKF